MTKVQLSKRMDCCRTQGKDVYISVGSSREYDPNDDLCRPKIGELEHKNRLVDYLCTSNPKAGKFVKLAKTGTGANSLTICEAKVFGYPAGKQPSNQWCKIQVLPFLVVVQLIHRPTQAYISCTTSAHLFFFHCL